MSKTSYFDEENNLFSWAKQVELIWGCLEREIVLESDGILPVLISQRTRICGHHV